MRYLFLILFVLFAYSIPLIADSKGGRQIANYDIEGFRLGDSLLDTYSEREIKMNRQDWYKDAGVYTVSTFDRGELGFQFLYKINDKKYILQGIDLVETMSYSKCKKKMKVEKINLREFFPNAKEKSSGPLKHWADTSNKSTSLSITFTLKSNDVVVLQCIDWSSNVDWSDNYRISVWEKNANQWLNNL